MPTKNDDSSTTSHPYNLTPCIRGLLVFRRLSARPARVARVAGGLLRVRRLRLTRGLPFDEIRRMDGALHLGGRHGEDARAQGHYEGHQVQTPR